MKKSTSLLLATLVLSVTVSAQASDYKICRTSFDITNHYRKPIMYTATVNDTVISRRVILPHRSGSVPFAYLAGQKEACNRSNISLLFRPSEDCIDRVLSESHRYDACLAPEDRDSAQAFEAILSHLLSYGLEQRVDFSLVVLDISHLKNPQLM